MVSRARAICTPLSIVTVRRTFLSSSRASASSSASATASKGRVDALMASSASTTQAENASPARTHNGLTVLRVPVLNDNFSWLVHDEETGATAVVDPAEVDPIVQALEARSWKLTHVLNTHHHWDHTGGNEILKERFNVTVVGPEADSERIPGIDVELSEGDEYMVGSSKLVCYDTPGHTKGHITLHFPSNRALFPGDTLFSMGCGRLFEGTPAQMWASLRKMIPLPKDTLVYCAHEYTLSNAKFAMHVEPGNEALQRRFKEVEGARRAGVATVPSDLGTELETNPFLRPWSEEIRQRLGIGADADDVEAFGAIRRAKDNF